jgi:hypothetical protein
MQRCLSSAREKLRNGHVESRIRLGEPVTQILAEIDQGSYDLVILGSNEAPGLKRYFLGSVTTRVVRRAPITVLVAKQARSRLERFLICSGGAGAGELVVQDRGTAQRPTVSGCVCLESALLGSDA